ncbi:MAG: LysR family transcriptional regulator, partial [Betaproteobacteria bacterium]
MNALTELEFFAVLMKQGSLSAAARELDLTPPAVSKRLSQLEARLGVRLLNRTTRHISLTTEGEVYLNYAQHILRDVREMEQEVLCSRAQPKGLLRVNATLGFGRSFIAPAVSALMRQHPDMEVQLSLTAAPQSLAEGDFDVGIRFGSPPDSNVIARKLMANRRFICASPLYLQKHPAPQTPADLVKHNCIVLRQDETAYGIWRFKQGENSETVKVKGSLSSNDGEVVLNWALDGHGIL